MRWFNSDRNFLILLFSVFLILSVFCTILTFEISDLSGAITSFLKEISGFTNLVEARLQNFESRLEGLENKFENLTNLPQKDTVLPDLSDQELNISLYDDPGLIIEYLVFGFGFGMYLYFMWLK